MTYTVSYITISIPSSTDELSVRKKQLYRRFDSAITALGAARELFDDPYVDKVMIKRNLSYG
jgi:hypothetical protein